MRTEVYASDKTPCPVIDYMGFSGDSKVTQFGPAQRNLYIIHYITQGKGYFNQTPLSAGQGFLITPGMQEHYYPDPNDPWHFLWIVSSDSAMADFFPRLQPNPDTGVFSYDFIPAVQKVAAQIVAAQNGIFDELQILAWFLQIATLHTNPAELRQKSSQELYLDFALNHIETNLYLPISVKDLTGLLGISQPYLYRLFDQRFHQSPKQYILHFKFSYAKKLLRETEMSVTEIANSVGYHDVLAFSKLFSAREGISPQHYRKAIKG